MNSPKDLLTPAFLSIVGTDATVHRGHLELGPGRETTVPVGERHL